MTVTGVSGGESQERRGGCGERGLLLAGDGTACGAAVSEDPREPDFHSPKQTEQ